MNTRSTVRIFITLCFFALTITVGAIIRPAYAQCDKVTDSQIVAGIYAKINADKGLASQVSHINVVSVSGTLKFQGWADDLSDYERIVGFGVNASCVRMLNVNNFMETPPPTSSGLRSTTGCASGTKPCGDVCIPEADACNISKVSLFVPIILFDLDRSFKSESAMRCG